MAYSRSQRPRGRTRATGRGGYSRRTGAARTKARGTTRRKSRASGGSSGRTIRIVVHTVAQPGSTDISRPYALSEIAADKRKATF